MPTNATLIEHEHETTWTVGDRDMAWLMGYQLDKIITHSYYYDAGTKILDVGGTFRVRYTIDDFGRRKVPAKVTLKLVRGFTGDVRHAVETTGEFRSPEPPVRLHSTSPLLPAECRSSLATMGITCVSMVGILPCIRRRLQTPLGKIELDTVELPGGKLLHELELENDDPDELVVWTEWVKGNAGTAVLSHSSKHVRFRQALSTAML